MDQGEPNAQLKRRGMLAGVAAVVAGALAKVGQPGRVEAGHTGPLDNVFHLEVVNNQATPGDETVSAITSPTVLVSDASGDALRVRNLRGGGEAIEAIAGPGQSTPTFGLRGGTGVVARGGSFGGFGIDATGGNSPLGDGGDGILAHGGSSSSGTGGVGVEGVGGSGTKDGVGVRGNSVRSIGVLGVGSGSAATFAVPAEAAGVYGLASSNTGVRGQSTSNFGVYGTSANSTGVAGDSPNYIGVFGNSNGGVGMWANSSTGYALYGVSTAGIGLYGSSGSYIGISAASGSSTGLFATSNTGLAAFFQGPVQVQGSFTVIGGPKSAAVPHPDGSHRRMYCVESTESWFDD